METGTSLREWEERALKRCGEAAQQQKTLVPPSLVGVFKNHGFGYFHLVMQYWLVDPEETRYPQIPDPQPYAASIAQNCSHYFESDAGLLGAQCASTPMGGALHYYAATGQHDSLEMVEMRRVFREYKLASFTSEFLRSAATANPVPLGMQGDVRNKTEHVRIAANWFGVDGHARTP
ncbi:hypothetical protein B0A55_02702 [Friedmanniomyces simplex]|uniref:Uncharacterized protein n=1 Tax=Friedmanniomyces simplex TaxID=329884 RepID=A0A4V5NHW5_9PEZI|nr:hypothetical protein B0A55_02702 [Friedmanniomyces simplex]